MLLSPFQLTSHLRLKNRMVKAPQSSWWWNEDGTVSDRAIRAYEGMAAGGASALIIAAVLWEPVGTGIYLSAFEDRFVEGMQRFTEVMHRHDCAVICQLHHMGPSAWGTWDGGPPIGPSDLGEEDLPTPPPFGKPTRGLSVEEIHEKQQRIVEAAVRAQQGGFDGVEIHAAHGYFLASFLSPVFNRRTDDYGWERVEDRTRIVSEVLSEVRQRCGERFVVGTRINGQEFHPHRRVLTIADAKDNAVALEKAGVDYVSVSGYGFGPLYFRYCPDYFPYPQPESHMQQFMARFRKESLWAEPARAIKQVVEVPVMVSGRMDENRAEACLRDGTADIIALGRTLWADPHFPRKIAEGRIDDVVRCTRCASCEDPVTSPRICRVNPSLGREAELAVVQAKRPKKVMVVGGGPAGMEAARVLALRGHQVAIFEKSHDLGGRLRLAAMIKGDDVENVLPILDYLRAQVRKLGIPVRLNTEVTPELLKKLKPDAVVLAASGEYAVPRIPGISGRNVFTISSLAQKVKLPMRVLGPNRLHTLTRHYLPLGRKVVVLGGQIEGLQGAVFLKKRGREVTVIEEGETIGAGIPERYIVRMLPWFEQKGVEILTRTRCEEIADDGVRVVTEDAERFIHADSVLVLMPQVPRDDLVASFKDVVNETYAVGSCLGAENGLLKHALLDGRTVGCSI